MSDRPDTFRLIIKSMLAAALIVVLLLAAGRLMGLFALAFGAVVIGVLLDAFADVIAQRTPLTRRWSLAAALVVIVAVVGGGAWLFGAELAGQFSQLLDRLPDAIDSIRTQASELPGGQSLFDSISEGLPGNEAMARVAGLVRSVAGGVIDLVILLFGGIYIGARPSVYRGGLVQLFPRAQRPLVDDALKEAGLALRRWMLGQLVSMLLIGVLTGFGLWLVGVDSAPALGVIAGLTEIIPWAGPIIASVPILIIALAQGPETALLALGVMLVVQQAEGNLIMPYIQKQAVRLPPALHVFGVVAGGVLFGPVGLIFAGPLLVVVFVLVKRLYVEGVLGTPTPLPSDRA